MQDVAMCVHTCICIFFKLMLLGCLVRQQSTGFAGYVTLVNGIVLMINIIKPVSINNNLLNSNKYSA